MARAQRPTQIERLVEIETGLRTPGASDTGGARAAILTGLPV